MSLAPPADDERTKGDAILREERSTSKRQGIGDIYTLSPMQEGMLFHDLFEQERTPGRPIPYLLELTFRITGDLDLERFEESWNRLVARHQILRSIYNHSAAERPVQIVLQERRIALEVHDLTDRSAAEQQRFVAAYERQQRETPFDLTRDLLMRIALLRLTPDSYRMVWMFHHIVMDGWCINILQRELFTIYQALGEGRAPELPPAPLYSDYIKYLQGWSSRSSDAFWRRYLAGYEQAVSPPGWRRLAATARTELLHHACVLSRQQSAALRHLAAAQQVTLSNLFQAAWGLLLARYNPPAEDVAFGIVVSGRPHEVPGITDMVGLCTNTIPLRLRITPDLTLAGLAAAARESYLAVEEHQYSSLAEIQAQSQPKRELINHLLVFESYPLDPRFDAGRAEPVAGLVLDDFAAYMPNNYDFQLAVFPEQTLRFVLSYRRGAFDSRQIAFVAGHLRRVLDAMVAAPSTRALEVDILTAEERRELLAGGPLPANPALPETPETNAPCAETLAARLHRLLTRPAQPIAVTAGGVDLADLGYDELRRRAGGLAELLRERHGIVPGRRVALLLPPGADLVGALFAVVLAGGTFVPLDPLDPPARLRHILADCAPALVLTSGDLAALAAELGAAALALDPAAWDELALATDAALPAPGRTQTCYILYTSGTTGRPKGVKVGEESLLNYVDWLRDRHAVGPLDSSALLSSHAFDLGFTASLGTLLNGGRLHLPGEAMRRDPEALVAYAVAQRLTFLKLTPPLLHLLLHAANAERWSAAEDLRLVFVGGEGYVTADLAAFQRLCPWAELRNHYGPTECTIGCISHRLDPREPDVAAGRQVLGLPIDGAAAFLLGSRLEPVPVGVAGEIYMGGRCLAQGYTAGAAADAERFLRAPWDGARRLYRTGDRAERRADGTFVFLGRADDQLKVRGYRIEPGEVEAALRRTPPVGDAVVLVLRDADGRPDLAAFVTCATAELDVATLRRDLAALLPDFMIPSQFIAVSRFPLTANGKVDRRALAHHQPAIQKASGGEVVGATESALRDIWQAVLAHESIGPDDNFFALGGQSVKAILVLSRVMKKLGVKLAVRDIFDHPTLRALARRIDGSRTAPRGRAVQLRAAPAGAARIFFLPPLIGTSTLYQEVVAAVDREIGAWGLQCRGFDAEEPFDQDLAAMAALFAGEIRRLQAGGPYLLCGYSMGVRTALETAALLEAGGERTSLILIDGAIEGTGYRAETAAELRQSRHFARVLAILAENLEPRDMERIGRLAEHNLRLLRGHRFQSTLRGNLFCIEAAESAQMPGMTALRGCTTGRFDHRWTPGDHTSLFQPPHGRRLIEHLSEAVDVLTRAAAAHRV